MKKRLYQFHLWVAAFAALPMLLWTLSGITHPLMVWTSPEPALKTVSAAIAPDFLRVTLSEALAANGLETISNLGIVQIEEEQYYRVGLAEDQESVYLSTQTGEILPQGEWKHAESLARLFTADSTSKVTSIRRIDRFDEEYKSASQYLPVWKVQFERDDGMRAYVDLSGGRLATLVNNWRGGLLWFFSTFHSWKISGLPEAVRIGGIALFSLLVFLGSISGLIVRFSMKWKLGQGKAAATSRGRLQSLHRKLGLVVSLAMLMFSFSGFWHVLVAGVDPEFRFQRPHDLFERADLQISPLQVIDTIPSELPVRDISLIQLKTGPHYLVSLAGSGREMPAPIVVQASDGMVLKNGDILYAARLAEYYLESKDLEFSNQQRLTKFHAIYNPFYKRLPVIELEGKREESLFHLFIDPVDGAIALSQNRLGKWESLSFTWLHKWHFLDALGLSRKTRDLVMVTFAFGGAVVAVLGCVLIGFRFVSSKRRHALSNETRSGVNQGLGRLRT